MKRELKVDLRHLTMQERIDLLLDLILRGYAKLKLDSAKQSPKLSGTGRGKVKKPGSAHP